MIDLLELLGLKGITPSQNPMSQEPVDMVSDTSAQQPDMTAMSSAPSITEPVAPSMPTPATDTTTVVNPDTQTLPDASVNMATVTSPVVEPTPTPMANDTLPNTTMPTAEEPMQMVTPAVEPQTTTVEPVMSTSTEVPAQEPMPSETPTVAQPQGMDAGEVKYQG